MTTTPKIQPLISHHLLLCATPTKAKCCDPADGLETWNALTLKWVKTNSDLKELEAKSTA